MFMPFPPATAFGAAVDCVPGSEMQIDDNVNDLHFASLDWFVRSLSPLTLASARFVGRGLG